MKQAITSPIPTHIITGFLGSGKTTLISHLMAQKPAHETWAILVNEFGEIGIDGKLLGSENNEAQQVYIKEIPGGCMCCTSGLPMQIALAQLISRSRPQRIIIEPTGLGHPEEVIAELQSEHNREVMQLMAVMTLFDARKLNQKKYYQHPVFKQQLQIADILVANKADLYVEDDISTMANTLRELNLSDKELLITEQGKIDFANLAKPTARQIPPPAHHHHGHNSSTTPAWQERLESEGAAYTQHQKEGFITEGWIYDGSHIFDFNLVFSLLSSVSVERLKGVFITERGIFGFNKAEDILSCVELDESDDSRLELIYPDSSEFAQQGKLELSTTLKTRLS
ncbi:CobW family GTP-binding protein [Planctobacterium marinum]|uniref:CobW/HypB/UreG nucleotide-binding domain-containing protein n=1 Tax=Planctobacterium marinum TaxID=1631968 RepID=A0AA48KUI3_9ALTE|nr:hypothetical protein MACH26_41350 [Planctobacterium marinum]